MNRRQFLKNSVALAGAAAAASLAAPAGEDIRTGIIGTGNRGGHLWRSLVNLDGVKMVAACDLKADRLDKALSVASRDNPTGYSDYRKLLERKDIDAVFIATPCDLHVEMAIAALQAGKHVYCEKPRGITPESIARLLKVARSSKTVLQVGQQMRYGPQLRETIAKIHEGVAGKIIMVKAQRHAGNDLDHDGPSADWFFDAKRSGDVIVEMAVHNLDVCNWAINCRPERAAGFGGVGMWVNEPPGRTSMDGYTLSYEYVNGVKMSFTQVFFHPRGLPGNGQYFYVYGTKGAVDVSGARFYPMGRGEPQVLSTAQRLGGEPQLQAFYDCIRNGAKPVANVNIAAVAALTVACRQGHAQQ
ncbi:MAG: Gfo/Idh/MocA family oxidoreductase [Acidobacteria bacterium]|nr:Gfo/Idh/MocA family oxidoreductase [Acidobacteriota bacterium]